MTIVGYRDFEILRSCDAGLNKGHGNDGQCWVRSLRSTGLVASHCFGASLNKVFFYASKPIPDTFVFSILFPIFNDVFLMQMEWCSLIAIKTGIDTDSSPSSSFVRPSRNNLLFPAPDTKPANDFHRWNLIFQFYGSFFYEKRFHYRQPLSSSFPMSVTPVVGIRCWRLMVAKVGSCYDETI